MPQLLELGADLQVVVNFAVEDDDGIAIGRLDGLVAAGYVQNRQPGSAKRAQGGLVARPAGRVRDGPA